MRNTDHLYFPVLLEHKMIKPTSWFIKIENQISFCFFNSKTKQFGAAYIGSSILEIVRDGRPDFNFSVPTSDKIWTLNFLYSHIFEMVQEKLRHFAADAAANENTNYLEIIAIKNLAHRNGLCHMPAAFALNNQ